MHGAGTGGTMMGVKNFIDNRGLDVKCILTVPEEDAALHGIQGINDGADFLLDRSLMKDVVEVKGDFYKVTGRINDVINVGGLKFMSSEVELVALTFPNVSLVKVISRQNPITGQHVELLIQPNYKCSIDKKELMNFLQKKLLPHMVPKRISVEDVTVGHRFKKI